jgi:hypothetical protein
MTRAKQNACIRKGCDRLVREGSVHSSCTPACGVLHRFAIETENIIGIVGEGPHADQLRDATDDLLESFDDLLSLRRRIKAAANTAGISNLVWTQVLRGEAS